MAAEQNTTVLQLDMEKETFLSILGEPKKISVREHPENSDWDLLGYVYDGLEIYFYRIVNSVEILYVYSNMYEIQIDRTKIYCGESKKEIENKLGAGVYDRTDKTGNTRIYYYELQDLRNLIISYNTENIAVNIFYGYVY